MTKEDKANMRELAESLAGQTDPEEIEAVRKAMLEILDDEPNKVRPMQETLGVVLEAGRKAWDNIGDPDKYVAEMQQD